jgi:glycosyltransferase involved in cell wall biosynthesis
VRVLIVNKYARVTGGADQYCLLLTKGLRERGHEVAWLSTESARNEESHGVFLPWPAEASGARDVPRETRVKLGSRAFWNPIAAAGMRRALRDFRPDLVSTHKLYPQLSVAPLVMAARRHVPIVQTLHDYDLIAASLYDHRGSRVDRDDPRLLVRALSTSTFPVRRWVHPRCVDVWISISRFVERTYARRGIRSVLIPNGTQGRGSGQQPLAFSAREGIVFVSRLVAEKGVLDVLELARLLPEVPVTVAGSGPLASAVRAEAARLPNLRAPGWVEPGAVLGLVRSARVAVVPSRWAEPSGRGALEAMAEGTPVVAFDSGGLGELVRESGGGRTVPHSAEALATACAEIYDDPGSWELLSRRGIRTIEHERSTELWVDRIAALFQRVVSSGGRISDYSTPVVRAGGAGDPGAG